MTSDAVLSVSAVSKTYGVAFEVFLEPARRYGHGARSHECDRTFRRPLTDQVQGRMVRAQLT